jgi:hypothetical protein
MCAEGYQQQQQEQEQQQTPMREHQRRWYVPSLSQLAYYPTRTGGHLERAKPLQAQVLLLLLLRRLWERLRCWLLASGGHRM